MHAHLEMHGDKATFSEMANALKVAYELTRAGPPTATHTHTHHGLAMELQKQLNHSCRAFCFHLHLAGTIVRHANCASRVISVCHIYYFFHLKRNKYIKSRVLGNSRPLTAQNCFIFGDR